MSRRKETKCAFLPQFPRQGKERIEDVPEASAALQTALQGVSKQKNRSLMLELEARRLGREGVVDQAAEMMHRALLLAQTAFPNHMHDVTSTQHHHRNKAFFRVISFEASVSLTRHQLDQGQRLLNVLSFASSPKALLQVPNPATVAHQIALLYTPSRSIWAACMRGRNADVEEAIQKAKEITSKDGDLWREKVMLMEYCWRLKKGEESGLEIKLAELYSQLLQHLDSRKSLQLLLALCSVNLCALYTAQNHTSALSHWYHQAKSHSHGLEYHGLSTWIDQFRPLHHKSQAYLKTPSKAAKDSTPPKDTERPHFVPALNHIFHSVTTPQVSRHPVIKRHKTTVDDYAHIERLLRHPVTPNSGRILLTETTSEYSLCRRPDLLGNESSRISEKTGNERENKVTAAMEIQRCWRGYRLRRKLKEHSAAAIIQIRYRRYVRTATQAAHMRIRHFARLFTLTHLKNIAKNIQSERKMMKNALILQTWFRQKLGLVTIWMKYEGKKALESTASTKPETVDNSQVDIQDSALSRQERISPQSAVLRIQKTYKGYIIRTEFLSLRGVVIRLQAWFRALKCRKMYRNVRKAAINVQKHWKGVRTRQLVALQRGRILRVQALFRGWSARKTEKNRLSAVVTIQCFFRRHKQKLALIQGS